MNTPSEKIEVLQKSLSRAVSGRITALEEITRRQTEAQNTIEAFASNPSPEQVTKVYAAHVALATGRELLARFGDLKSWQARLESAWITSHQVELVALLEGVVRAVAYPQMREVREPSTPRVVVRPQPPKAEPLFFIGKPSSPEVLGPYRRAEIEQLRTMKIITEETVFCREGTEDWMNSPS